MKNRKKIAILITITFFFSLLMFLYRELATTGYLRPYCSCKEDVYLLFYFRFYTYFLITLFIFKAAGFILKYNSRAKTTFSSLLKILSLIISSFFAVLVVKNLLFFYHYFFVIIFISWAIVFYLFNELFSGNKNKVFVLLIVLLFPLLALIFLDGYYIELLYNNKNTKKYEKSIEFIYTGHEPEPTLIKRSIFCLNKTPSGCKFVCSQEIGMFGGWGGYAGGYSTDCVYMCPK